MLILSSLIHIWNFLCDCSQTVTEVGVMLMVCPPSHVWWLMINPGTSVLSVGIPVHAHSTWSSLSPVWWLLSKNKSCIIFFDLALEITDHSPMLIGLSGGHMDLTSQWKECLSYSKEITWNNRCCCHHLGKYNLPHFTSFGIISIISCYSNHQTWSNRLLLSLWYDIIMNSW